MKYFYLLCLLVFCSYSGRCQGQFAVAGGSVQAAEADSSFEDAAPDRALLTPREPIAGTIGQIIIEGNKVTRRKVILREISIREGDLISVDSLARLIEETKLRLLNLQLFNEVDQHTVVDSSGIITWYISVKERWYIIPSVTIQYADRNFNTWFVKENHDLRRVTGGLTLTDKNFRGNLETLAVTAQDGYTQGLGISYLRPYANEGQTRGFGFLLNASQSRQTYYNTDSNKLVYAGTYSGPIILHQFQGGLTYVYRPAYASRHIFQLSYNQYTVSDTIVKLNPEYFANKSNKASYLELFYRYEYNGTDNWNYPLIGYKLVATGTVREGFEGINFQSFGKVEAGMFRPLMPKWYFSAIFRGRLMYPADQPYYFRSGLGTNTDYVRGYEYYVIDGSNYGLLRIDLKREVFNNTYSLPVTYFTALPLRIYPKIFADAGYIDSPSPGNSFLSKRLLYSVGVGVDIITLYDIKFRFEFAWNHLGQNGLYLHFNSE